jgi:hypothetical protein
VHQHRAFMSALGAAPGTTQYVARSVWTPSDHEWCERHRRAMSALAALHPKPIGRGVDLPERRDGPGRLLARAVRRGIVVRIARVSAHESGFKSARVARSNSPGGTLYVGSLGPVKKQKRPQTIADTRTNAGRWLKDSAVSTATRMRSLIRQGVRLPSKPSTSRRRATAAQTARALAR